MQLFRNLKFKMKLGYECWSKGCELKKLVIDAIARTLDESLSLATANLQIYLNMDDGVPEIFGLS